MLLPLYDSPKPLIPIVKSVEEKKETKPVEYVVKDGDNLTTIAEAQKTTVERLWAKNATLTDPNVIKPGEALIVPKADEVLDARALPAPPTPFVPTSTTYTVTASGNGYSYGYCTFGVKSWRPDIPNNWGDAYRWLSNAQAQGWATGSEPRVGAIGWARNYGHVAIVIAVDGSSVTVREENYRGWGVVSTRVTNTSEWLYIY